MFGKNSLDEGLNSKQVLSLVLYFVFLCVSVWATGESIARSSNLPVVMCYGIGLAALLGASFCLGLIQSGYRLRSPLKLFIGIVGFLLLWFVSLTSNTHNFYLVGSIDDIRQEELRTVKNSLEQFKDKGDQSIANAEQKFISNVGSLIASMEEQITNEGDPGIGPKARGHIKSLDSLLQSSITILTNEDYDKLASQMADQVRRIMSDKLDDIKLNEKRLWLQDYLNQPEYADILNRLEYSIDNFDEIEVSMIKKNLRDAYSFFNKSNSNIESILQVPFFKENIDLGIIDLPETPRSIVIENIANSWEYIKERKDYNNSRFILAFIWALAVDIAAFVLFYFGFLPDEEDY